MSYYNQTLFLSGRVGSEDETMYPEEVRHSHVRYALMNIPRTKTSIQTLCGKDHDGNLFLYYPDAESVMPVRSSIACLCDLQMALMWLLRARRTAVINLDLIDRFSMVENTPNPSESITLEASDAQKSFLKQWNAG